MNLKLYMTAQKTEALGPGKRYAVWVQGCDKRCPGCISPDAQDKNGGYDMNVSELAREILSVDRIEGITVSGGEPFLQQEALCELINTVRQKRDLGVIVYTGMKYEEISSTPLAKLCDIIIDGEYIEELNDGKSLRGSSNQRVISLTPRYADIISEHYGVDGRKVEFIIKDSGVQMIGIPNKTIKIIIEEN